MVKDFILHSIMAIVSFWNVVLVMHSVYGGSISNKKSKMNRRLGISISFAALILAAYIQSCVLKKDTNIILPVLYLFLSFLIMDENWKDCIQIYLLSYLVTEIAGTIVYTFMAMALHMRISDMDYKNPEIDLLCTCILGGIWLFIFWLRRNQNCRISLNLRRFVLYSLLEILAMLQIAFVGYVIGDGVRNNVRFENAFVLLVMTGSAVSMILFLLYVGKLEQLKDMQRNLIERYVHEQIFTKEYYTKLYTANEQTRARQHDTHHMVRTLEIFIKENKTDAALNMIHNWQGSETKIRKLSYSQNQILDAVIDGVLGEEIQNKKIEFLYQGRLPAQIGVSDLDFCLLLSNLMENAKEAASLCEKFENECPKIEMKVWMQGNLLMIDICNSYKKITKEKIKDPAWHGYGIRNVQEIVNHYNGKLDFEISNTIFSVHVVLEMKECV